MAKIPLKKRLERYEDFYDRCFSTVDVDKIYEEGGGASFNLFKTKSRGKTKNKDFWEVMFKRKKVKQEDKLGFEIYKRFFEKEEITQNKLGRVIVRTGEKFTFKGKVYKGGMFVPRTYLTRRY